MADNVDISLKLGTEADISSAISAGARAGAAFAAAAQAAVGGISLSTSASMRAFTTSSRQVSSGADLSREIRNMGLINGLIAQMAVRYAAANGGNGNNGGWGSKPFAPAFPDPRGGNNLPQNQWRFTYSGWKQIQGETPEVIDAEWYEKTEKSITNIDKLITKAYGRGGGGGPLTPYYQTTGDQIVPKGGTSWKSVWADLRPGMAAGKAVQTLLEPIEQFAEQYYGAEYRAATARSAQGFMRENLEKHIAFRNMQTEIGMWAGIGAGASAGSLLAPITGGASVIVGGIIGGIAGLVNKFFKQTANEKEKQELEQQIKTATEVNKREGLRSLFGGSYSPSYARAFEELGFGGSESQVQAMSENALTFRGRQAFGQVGLHEYTMMAQVPNYFAAVNNGVTDPQVLHSLLQHDLNNLGDPQLAAYIASQLPGIGLGTYATINSDYYGQTFNRLHSRILRGEDRRIAGISAGYLNKNARNVILTQAEMAAEMEMDAYTAPESMYAGFKPTREQYEQAERDKSVIKQSVMRGDTAYGGNNYVINVVVDGEVVKTENIQERDFVMGGMSYAVGGN